ncbi:MAG: futalosine hydrolase [Bacteroidetes bacterium]|nr:futalosine hydrolase [Bacteroidota bacterium]
MKGKSDFCSMQILLTAATPNEIELFINHFPNVDILITGVGAPATIYHLQKKLYQSDYDMVIQAGIGGAFSNNLELGEVVFIKQDTFGDLGAEEKRTYTPFFSTGLIKGHEFPFADGWLINATSLPKDFTLKGVKAVTINKVSDSYLQKIQLTDNFDPQVESMEGAAFHYVCLQEHVPFLQLRAISNYVGERDKSKWKFKEAFENLNAVLTSLIRQLKD